MNPDPEKLVQVGQQEQDMFVADRFVLSRLPRGYEYGSFREDDK
jgi:hypothetical protein